MDVTLKGLRKALEQAAAKPGAPFKKARITTFFENPVVTRALEAMLAQRAIRKMRATVQIVSTARDLFDAHKALAVEVSAEDAKAIDKLVDQGRRRFGQRLHVRRQGGATWCAGRRLAQTTPQRRP